MQAKIRPYAGGEGEGMVAWEINKCFFLTVSACAEMLWKKKKKSCEKSYRHHFHFSYKNVFLKHSEIRGKKQHQADTEG